MTPIRHNLIGGRWVEGSSQLDNVNPSDTREVVSRHSLADADEVREACAAARDAFSGWRRSTTQQRADILDAAAAEVLARREELGRLLASEEGKTLPEAFGEVTRAGHLLRFFAGEAVRLSGELGASIRPGVRVEVTREPVGVVALITPWNFPIAIPAWKIAPALAFGNCVVFKPSEIAPASAWMLVDILHRAGLPPGVLNLVGGVGAEVGQALVASAEIDAISFTGSVATGQAIAAAASPRMLKLQLEMGGKNPLLVLDDADLDVAVSCAVNGAFFSTGQRCTASSRLIVTRGIHDRFVDAMVARMRALKVDHALKTGTDIGPVVDTRQLEKSEQYLAIGKAEGAQLVTGGQRLTRETPGHYLEPALFTQTRADMRINREEIFGPVASVIAAENLDHALGLANDTEFGLAAGVCTRSLAAAEHFRREIQAGVVMVNLPTAGLDYHVPFGGRKASSHGPREQGAAARDFYTLGKTAYVSA
ncbi:aldehyde dehydrogenase family protein [Panacagrimonas sp.]|uniref:aldehyde dehydrogenase family protein n=1 Tax=Panacagrimonas sp. TaxID=2480088 RepID=UPI003B52D2DF